MAVFLNLKQIVDYFLLNGTFHRDVSLFHGKTGMSLFFFLYASQTHNPWYEEFAGELLEDVCNCLSASLPVTFSDGLCGIGWSIEFMKRQGFIEGDTDEILNEIDARVMERDVRRLTDTSLETGLKGIVAYVNSRLDSRRTSDYLPFEPTYLNELELACQRLNVGEQRKIQDMDATWQQILDLFSPPPADENESWRRGLILLNRKRYE